MRDSCVEYSSEVARIEAFVSVDLDAGSPESPGHGSYTSCFSGEILRNARVLAPGKADLSLSTTLQMHFPPTTHLSLRISLYLVVHSPKRSLRESRAHQRLSNQAAPWWLP